MEYGTKFAWVECQTDSDPHFRMNGTVVMYMWLEWELSSQRTGKAESVVNLVSLIVMLHYYNFWN